MNRSLVAFLIAFGASSGALAETVQLRSGPNTFGQGWLFLDFDGRCKVMTAAHVVSRNGIPVSVLLRDARNHEIEVGPPLQFSLTPDIAVLPVEAKGTSENCSRSRLSLIGVKARVQNLTNGFVEIFGQGVTERIRVERTTLKVDSQGGELFIVKPADRGIEVKQGWSGASVRDSEGPIGVIYSVDPDENEAYAVRVDSVTRLEMRQSIRDQKTTKARVRIAAVVGESIDPAQGPAGAINVQLNSWLVKPIKGRVAASLELSAPANLTSAGVELAADSTPRLLSLSIEAAIGEGPSARFLPIRTCATAEPTKSLSCTFAEQTRSQVQIIIGTDSDEPIAIRRLSVD